MHCQDQTRRRRRAFFRRRSHWLHHRGITGALSLAGLGGAIWEGSQTRFGKTMWQGVDAEILSGVSAAVGKRIFTRVRPIDENNPCLWFLGGSNYSFPSR